MTAAMAHKPITPTTTKRQAQLMRWASYGSVAVASLLLLAKLYAWWQTDSLSMLSSFIDSAFDLVMSIGNMLALRYALKPADDDHRFGHNAIEDIASLAQCAFIATGMAMIVMQAMARLATPQPLTNESLGIIVTLGALALTVGLVLFQTYVGRRARSQIVASDRMHYVGDILFNVGVLVALGVSAETGARWADPAMAIVIAAVVLWNTKPLLIRAFNNLMDREMPADEIATIHAVIEGVKGVRGHHQLKTRYSGNKPFIQMHVEIDANLNFREAHAIADRVENAVGEIFPGAEVIVHADPRE